MQGIVFSLPLSWKAHDLLDSRQKHVSPPVKCAPSTSCVPPIMTAVTIRKLDRAPNPRLEQNPTFFQKILIGRLSYWTVNPSTISIFFISSTSLERIFNRHVPGMDALASRENGLPCPGLEKGLPVNHNPRSALQRRSLLAPHPV